MKSYSWIFISHLSILVEGFAWGLLNSVSNGLWSVMTLKVFAYKYSLKCVIPHAIANASLSVCEYLCSTEVSALLAIAMMWNSSFSSFCTKIAPSPAGLASTNSSVSLSRLKYAFVQCSVILCLTVSNARCWSSFQTNFVDDLVSCLRGSVFVARSAMNQLQYWAKPMKLRT